MTRAEAIRSLIELGVKVKVPIMTATETMNQALKMLKKERSNLIDALAAPYSAKTMKSIENLGKIHVAIDAIDYAMAVNSNDDGSPPSK